MWTSPINSLDQIQKKQDTIIQIMQEEIAPKDTKAK